TPSLRRDDDESVRGRLWLQVSFSVERRSILVAVDRADGLIIFEIPKNCALDSQLLRNRNLYVEALSSPGPWPQEYESAAVRSDQPPPDKPRCVALFDRSFDLEVEVISVAVLEDSSLRPVLLQHSEEHVVVAQYAKK